MNSMNQEVRRSLHQHMMQLYLAYEKEIGTEGARQVVAEELAHIGAMFKVAPVMDDEKDSTETFWQAREFHRELGPYAAGYLHAYKEVERAREHRAIIEKGEQE